MHLISTCISQQTSIEWYVYAYLVHHDYAHTFFVRKYLHQAYFFILFPYASKDATLRINSKNLADGMLLNLVKEVFKFELQLSVDIKISLVLV